MKKSINLILNSFLFIFGINAQAPFITTWQTDNAGSSCSSCITIPTLGGGFNYDVDWDNDGVYDDVGLTSDITHDFGVAGEYTIAITGSFPWAAFDNAGDRLKLLSVDQWGDIQWRSLSSMFAGCENMDLLADDAPDLTNVTSLSDAFSNCRNLTKGFSAWDVSTILNFSSMFRNCRQFNEDISMWNTSSAINISSMFSDAVLFDQDLNNWDVSNVTNMSGTFSFARSFNQDLDLWDVSNVTTMFSLFNGAIIFNGNISNWDVSNVTDMGEMFGSVGQVVFPNPSAFNQDIGEWDVSNVTNMGDMFLGAESFNQDLSDWNVSSVTSMQSMFRLAESFDQDLSSWDLSALQSASFMLDRSGIMCDNYSSLLIGWAANPNTPDNITLGARDLSYDDMAEGARNQLISKGWVIERDMLGECSTSISEENKIEPNVSIAPNPTNNLVIINASETYRSVSVINLNGKLIGLFNENEKISLSNYNDGTYLLRIQFDNKSIVQKIVKH